MILYFAVIITLFALIIYLLSKKSFSYGLFGAVGKNPFAEGYTNRLRPISGPGLTTLSVDTAQNGIRQVAQTIVDPGVNGIVYTDGQPGVISRADGKVDYDTFHWGSDGKEQYKKYSGIVGNNSVNRAISHTYSATIQRDVGSDGGDEPLAKVLHGN